MHLKKDEYILMLNSLYPYGLNNIQVHFSSTYVLGVQYNHVVTQTLLGMRITVLAKSEHINKISSVESASVKTGRFFWFFS